MSERVYHKNRTDVFKQCDLNPKDKTYTCHHLIEKFDVKRGLVPKNYPINSRQNLVPLLADTHNDLHFMLDNIPRLNRIDLRVYMGNMAFNNELDLVPDRLYYSNPLDMMRKH